MNSSPLFSPYPIEPISFECAKQKCRDFCHSYAGANSYWQLVGIPIMLIYAAQGARAHLRLSQQSRLKIARQHRELGSPMDLYDSPANQFVAGF